MDLDELLRIIGGKEVELATLRKHVANLEELVANLRAELETKPTMELVELPKEVAQNIPKKKK